MPQTDNQNRRFVLAERPKGEPTLATLRLETAPIPAAGPDQMLLRTDYLSLDPYMRGRMSDAPCYAAPVAVGGVMEGGTVAQVVSSHVAGFSAGDRVLCFNGWQDYALLRKRLTMRGFIIFQDFGDLYPEFAKAMGDWLAAGKMQYREEMIEGLEAAPQAFIGLLRGENFGKRVIHVGPTKMIENKEKRL